MAENEKNLFVAREADLQALWSFYEAALEDRGALVWVEAPFGGGKRALLGEFGRRVEAHDEDVILWRTTITEEEDGLRALLRLYAGLYAYLHRNPLLRTKVEMILNSQMPQHPARVQNWLKAFIQGLKRGPKEGEESFQVNLPRDNPLVGLVEVARAVSSKVPVVLQVQNLHLCHSINLFALFEGLLEAAGDRKLLLVLGTEPQEEGTQEEGTQEEGVRFAEPLVDFRKRRGDDCERLVLEPWSEQDVQAYLESKDLAGNAAGIQRLAGGKPGFVAELVDLLEERGELEADLSEATLASLTPMEVDEDELDAEAQDSEGQPGKGERRRATAEDGPVVHHVAALMGNVFPSNLLADMLGLDRDSLDDLLDACEDLYKELQYSEQIQSWLYAFRRGIFRHGILEVNTGDEARQRTLRVGNFMERFLAPRSREFLLKTLRLYAMAGEERRARLIKSMLMSSEVPDSWAMTHDFLKYFDQVGWPDPMWRTVYLNLLDRMVKMNAVDQAERLFTESLEWAHDREDRPMEAQILLSGSILDHRRGDLYRARDRGRDALTLFKALDNEVRVAEVMGHLAMVELADGNPTAALEQVEQAEKTTDIPPIRANAEMVRGLVDKRERKFSDAVEHFRRANEIAGKAGLGPLALQAAVNLGECLYLDRKPAQAADVLGRAVQIAQSLRNLPQERAASALLSQAQGAQKMFEAALKSARRTLEISKELEMERMIPIDTYNVGLFTLQLGNANEAVSLLRQAAKGADPNQVMFVKELQYHLGIALRRAGENAEARKALEACVEPAQKARDLRRVMTANQALGELAEAEGDKGAARSHFKAALAAAEQGNLRQERKALKRKLDTLG